MTKHGSCCTYQRCGLHYDDCRCSLDGALECIDVLEAELAGERKIDEEVQEIIKKYMDDAEQLRRELVVERAKWLARMNWAFGHKTDADWEKWCADIDTARSSPQLVRGDEDTDV